MTFTRYFGVLLFLGVVIFAQETEDDCRPEGCYEEAETGDCRAYIPRYEYNATTDECEEFIYGGCHKEFNNFRTKEECEDTCKPGCSEDN